MLVGEFAPALRPIAWSQRKETYIACHHFCGAALLVLLVDPVADDELSFDIDPRLAAGLRLPFPQGLPTLEPGATQSFFATRPNGLCTTPGFPKKNSPRSDRLWYASLRHPGRVAPPT